MTTGQIIAVIVLVLALVALAIYFLAASVAPGILIIFAIALIMGLAIARLIP